MTTIDRRGIRAIAVGTAVTLVAAAAVVLWNTSLRGAEQDSDGLVLTAVSAPVRARALPVRPLPGEITVVRGTAAPAKRLVTLQVYRSGVWRNVRSTRTGAKTAYAFSVRATATNTAYRVPAPAAKIKKKKYTARISNVVRVQGHAGRASSASPTAPTGQQRNGVANVTPVVAAFTPARPGKAVRVMRLVNGTWTIVANGVQDSAGVLADQCPGDRRRQHVPVPRHDVPGCGCCRHRQSRRHPEREVDGLVRRLHRWLPGQRQVGGP